MASHDNFRINLFSILFQKWLANVFLSIPRHTCLQVTQTALALFFGRLQLFSHKSMMVITL